MVDEDLVFLQNCMNFLKVAPGSHSDTYVPSRVGYQLNDIKVEYIAAIQQEKDPLLITSPVRKFEHEVSYVCTLLCTFHVLC